MSAANAEEATERYTVKDNSVTNFFIYYIDANAFFSRCQVPTLNY
jgi:hypothetical protein